MDETGAHYTEWSIEKNVLRTLAHFKNGKQSMVHVYTLYIFPKKQMKL